MAEYQCRFGAHTIRIAVVEDHGTYVAELFTVDDHNRLLPLLDEQSRPARVTGISAASVYLDALRLLTARFGPAT